MGLRKHKLKDGRVFDGVKQLKEMLKYIKQAKDADVLIIVQNNNEEMDVKTMMHGNWFTLREIARQHFEKIDTKTIMNEQASMMLAMLQTSEQLRKEREQKNG